MATARAACLLALLVGFTQALEISSQPKEMDQHKCKVLCQRFGMRALGEQFKDIKHPTECCKKCDEVYAMLEVPEPSTGGHQVQGSQGA
eukprot:CAMPEP_0170610736 /NCGR_PEP_ID=MMETSP0224-20130122/22818_1 /TAXON_ID=285029 /ORGANISM="Togula jolla, Strain CCCM 725" /LENGTH=88 /DNA_ID=CAMNT_0010936131 /DNA_START=1 /DNA_END=267 /DNA_ORIENTATION=-